MSSAKAVRIVNAPMTMASDPAETCKEFLCGSLQQLYDKDVEKWKDAPENAKRIKEVGIEQWLEELEDKRRCRHCDSKLPIGAKSCRVCGALVIRDTK